MEQQSPTVPLLGNFNTAEDLLGFDANCVLWSLEESLH